MYFAVADISCNPLLPPLVAFVISAVMSVAGISGAFILLPFQMSVLGYVNPSVSATNQLYNIVAVPAGVWRFTREGRMLWSLACIITIGTAPGVFLGAFLRLSYMPDAKTFHIFAGMVLLLMGLHFLQTLFSSKEKNQPPKTSNLATKNFARVENVRWSWRTVCYEYEKELYTFSIGGVFLLSLVVGIIGGAYGIGGGAIIAPILVSFFALPVHTIAGAALFSTLLTSVLAVIFYTFLAPYYPELAVKPDLLLGLLFGLGGMAGIYCGARIQKYLPARLIKVLLASVLVGLGLTYIF